MTEEIEYIAKLQKSMELTRAKIGVSALSDDERLYRILIDLDRRLRKIELKIEE